ncbi:MAG: DNA methyltransferase [Pseudomonadales bacterium]|nr:DNA methyltransferase [Pseudomonadales bacterium]
MLSLFAGVAGLDIGFGLAVPGARVVCYVEGEAYAAAVLAARIQAGALDAAPVWSDVCTFDAEPWRGVVDCVVGGFPCTDISNAGQRAGIEGERSGLWSHMARIIRDVRPRFVFVENVSALLVRGLDRVLADLHTLGFDAEWLTLRASDAGAPHRRERLFLLASRPSGGQRDCRRSPGGARQLDVGGQGLADARGRQLPVEGRGPEKRTGSRPTGSRVANATRVSGEWPSKADGGRRVGAFPPGPGDSERWRRVIEQRPWLAPAVDRFDVRRWEHTGIYPEPSERGDAETAQSPVRSLADGLAAVVGSDRSHALRSVGNGVVPLQAAVALVVLAERLGVEQALGVGLADSDSPGQRVERRCGVQHRQREACGNNADRRDTGVG